MKLATCMAVLIVTSAGAYSASAAAQSTIASSAANPAARCQGALPAFETAIRKRPLAVQNEGSKASFVTCSFEVDAYAAENGVLALDTYFTNTTAAPVSLTCTAVSGFAGGTNEFSSQTVSLVPGTQTEVFWEAGDFTNGLFDGLISISCALPPGVGVNDTYAVWDEDDSTNTP